MLPTPPLVMKSKLRTAGLCCDTTRTSRTQETLLLYANVSMRPHTVLHAYHGLDCGIFCLLFALW